MNDFAKALNAALVRLLANYGVTATEVTRYEDFTVYGGVCDTCRYEETRMRVFYTAPDGEAGSYEFMMTFPELISALTDAEPEPEAEESAGDPYDDWWKRMYAMERNGDE